LGIEAGGPSQDFCGNLVLLEGDAGVVQGMFGEVAKQLTQRFGAVQAMAFNNFIYLLEAFLATECESVSDSHITGK
jgi:hypothetical protein